MSTDDQDPWDDDEDIEEFLAAWEEVDRHAAGVLREALPDVLAEAAPEPDLAVAGARLRDGIGAGSWPHGYFVEACGWQQTQPSDDEELWRLAAACSISPPNDPGTPTEEQSAVMALEHADWLGMVLGLVRRGVGARCSRSDAARDIRECPEVDDQSEDSEGDEAVLGLAVVTLTPLWNALGILDDDDRLTVLGRWGLPRALYDVWASSVEDE